MGVRLWPGLICVLAVASGAWTTQLCFKPCPAPGVLWVEPCIGPDGQGLLNGDGLGNVDLGARLIYLKSAEDVIALMKRIPQGVWLRGVDIQYPKTPPELLAALADHHHTELRSLRLLSERLTDDDFKYLAKQKRLTDVSLGAPHVTAVGLAVLAELPKLRALDFQDGKTPVTDEGLKAMRGCKELHTLNLVRTRVTDAGLRHLRGLNKLQQLYLSDTCVRHLKELPELPKLTTLVLSGTGVGDDDIRYLTRCPQLVGIGLGGTKVTGATLDVLADTEKLEFLWLADAPITDAGLASIAKFTGLQFLNLQRTRVTDAGIAHLTKLSKLFHLDLEGTRVTDACLASLPKAHYLTLKSTRVTKDKALVFSRQHSHMVLTINEGEFVAGEPRRFREEPDDGK